MRTAGVAAALLVLTLVTATTVSSVAASESHVAVAPAIALQQPTTSPADTSPPITPTPAPQAAAENDPSTVSTVTTYLSTAVLIGAIVWSFWFRRRRARAGASTWRG